MNHLLIATRNSHKTNEIRAFLGPQWEVEDLNAHPDAPSPEETGATFAANATIKALAAAALFEGIVLADDSGLEVDALDGAPGVHSARYSGEHGNDAANRAKLLAALAQSSVRGKARSARFRCVIVLAEKGAILGSFDGCVEGIVINAERGEGGFGYDALFVPEGHCETFAQLPTEVKNRMSHRGRALEKALTHLRSTLHPRA